MLMNIVCIIDVNRGKCKCFFKIRSAFAGRAYSSLLSVSSLRERVYKEMKRKGASWRARVRKGAFFMNFKEK